MKAAGDGSQRETANAFLGTCTTQSMSAVPRRGGGSSESETHGTASGTRPVRILRMLIARETASGSRGATCAGSPVGLFVGFDWRRLEELPVTLVLIRGAPIHHSFVGSSSSAAMVEEEGSDSFAILNQVLDKLGIINGIPDVDGVATSGGREPLVRGEIVVLRFIITYLKSTNNPSRI